MILIQMCNNYCFTTWRNFQHVVLFLEASFSLSLSKPLSKNNHRFSLFRYRHFYKMNDESIISDRINGVFVCLIIHCWRKRIEAGKNEESWLSSWVCWIEFIGLDWTNIRLFWYCVLKENKWIWLTFLLRMKWRCRQNDVIIFCYIIVLYYTYYCYIIFATNQRNTNFRVNVQIFLHTNKVSLAIHSLRSTMLSNY